MVYMSHVDLEQGSHRRDLSADGSVCFSDADDGSCYSQFYSTNGGSYDEYNFAFVSDPEAGVVSDSRRASSVSDGSVQLEIEIGPPEIKVHLDKVERDCRICQLGLESNSHESGFLLNWVVLARMIWQLPTSTALILGSKLRDL
ncbi:RING/FYVE/PHD zinc finger superfamily protein [Prunus dulcis]|uniref:RING/FYVE/PHD zinc finger superfamily protein n=1 Tax=Prunus dulcis TaxID=3755 RepID=A0A4Y1RQN5_PRUDU|nr:RING/FYVE/PHD zinc finger superfamily protein [Prunus dulcis]